MSKQVAILMGLIFLLSIAIIEGEIYRLGTATYLLAGVIETSLAVAGFIGGMEYQKYKIRCEKKLSVTEHQVSAGN